jgi:hypothetical protein
VAIVEGYRARYDDNDETTLSSVALDKVPTLATAVDELSSALIAAVPKQSKKIKAARHSVYTYGSESANGHPRFQNVDLGQLATEFAKIGNDQVKTAATAVLNALNSTVVARYASSSRQQFYGSNGLAIYFPERKAFYDSDLLAQQGYDKANTFFPVAFVQDHQWSDFLQAYYALVP